MEVTPRRPNDMRRRSAVSSGRAVTLTAIQHHHYPQALPIVMASTAIRDGGFNEQDLIYVTKSPDYCRPDKQSGSFGTAGRTCNATQASSGGCASLCCGRGFVTVLREVVERCHCKYIWCCTVLILFCLYLSNANVIVLSVLTLNGISRFAAKRVIEK